MVAALTKHGLVALWEGGGGATNTGDATIIAKPDGSKSTAIYIRRSGHLAGGDHALIPVYPGCYVIKSRHHRRDFTHEIYRVVRAYTEGEAEDKKAYVDVVLVNKFDRGEWNTDLLSNLVAAVDVAEDKATTYHCREVMYAVLKEK